MPGIHTSCIYLSGLYAFYIFFFLFVFFNIAIYPPPFYFYLGMLGKFFSLVKMIGKISCEVNITSLCLFLVIFVGLLKYLFMQWLLLIYGSTEVQISIDFTQRICYVIVMWWCVVCIYSHYIQSDVNVIFIYIPFVYVMQDILLCSFFFTFLHVYKILFLLMCVHICDTFGWHGISIMNFQNSITLGPFGLLCFLYSKIFWNF